MTSYEDIRGQIKTGDLLFTSSGSWFSFVIRFFTYSIVSHVGVFVWIGGRLFIVESVKGVGVQILPFSNYLKKGNGRFWWGRVNHQFSFLEVFERVFNNNKDLPRIGDSYDLKGALLSKFFDTKSREVFCSEYVKKILNLKFPAYKSGVTPKDITAKTVFMKEVV